MSKRSLPNNYNSLTENISINPSSKKPKYIGQVPGIPTLTDRFFDEGAVTNLENEGNEGANFNIVVNFEDQPYINQHQYLWFLNVEQTKQQVKSLAQINRFLAKIQLDGRDRYYNEFKSLGKRQKAWIVDNIIPMGCLAIRNQRPVNRYSNAPKSVHNIEHHGRSFVLDYWSYKDKRVAAYANLYFVLKKIPLGKEHFYQTKISPGMFEDGIVYQSKDPIWQIIPHFENNGRINADALEFNDRIPPGGKDPVKGLGFYWYVGRVHEHQGIKSAGAISLRDEYTTSRKTDALYNMENNEAMHVYLLKDKKCPLLML